MSLLYEKLEEVKRTAPQERVLSVERQMYLHEGLSSAERAALSRRIRGKYVHLLPSSDAFAELKAEEIMLEDRRSGT